MQQSHPKSKITNRENVETAPPKPCGSEQSSSPLHETVFQRRNPMCFPKYNHFQPLPNRPFVSDTVNWNLYTDKVREAVPALEIMDDHCQMGQGTCALTSRKRFLSQVAAPRRLSTQFVPNSVTVIPEQQIRPRFSFGTYNGASGSQLLINSRLSMFSYDNLSHNTIRQLAALHYLQSPPSKYDTITCTVRESESVVGERNGEVLEEIGEGWAQPVILGNEREVKRQAYALLGKWQATITFVINITNKNNIQ